MTCDLRQLCVPWLPVAARALSSCLPRHAVNGEKRSRAGPGQRPSVWAPGGGPWVEATARGLRSGSSEGPASRHLPGARIPTAEAWKTCEESAEAEGGGTGRYFLLLEFIANKLSGIKALKFCSINICHKILGGNGLCPLVGPSEGCNSLDVN